MVLKKALKERSILLNGNEWKVENKITIDRDYKILLLQMS
jgi:hypothetical protein